MDTSAAAALPVLSGNREQISNAKRRGTVSLLFLAAVVNSWIVAACPWPCL